MSEPSTIIELACTDLPPPHARAQCRKCTGTNGYLARYIQVTGKVAIRWVCEWCEDYGTAPDLPRSILGEVDIEAIPVRIDRRGEYVPPAQLENCAVCGDTAAEFHHWAPVAIFPDWPIAKKTYPWGFTHPPIFIHQPALVVPMCTTHHREWHDRMRAHGLRWPHELEAA